MILHTGTYSGHSFDETRGGYMRSETALFDRNGVLIHEQRTEEKGRRLEWTPLEDISPALTAAVLAAEDRRFYRHRGVDWIALGRASLGFLNSDGRGASTISMQLMARLEPGLSPSGRRRTIAQKWRQIRAAPAFERRWSKEQILEAWLNLVTFRGELQGVAAAAGGLFDKKPHGLTQAESVILAALARAPNAETRQVIRRASALSGAMNLNIENSAIAALAEESLTRPYFIRPPARLADHVMRRLLRRARNEGKNPERLVSTLDGDLQQFAAETLKRHILDLSGRNVRDGAALVLDNASGDILAYVGSTGEISDARYVDGVEAARQAGSTLKPFIYGAAFDRKLLTAATLIEDSPLDVPAAGGLYRPSNYDSRFNGPVSVRTALASSLNIPAVRALGLVGVEAGVKLLETAGFRSLEQADYYGLSLALGAADVTLWDLTNAYRSLANGGVWKPARLTFEENSAQRRRVLSPEAAFILSDILSDRESRSRTFSLESPLATRFRTAVKTGTSKDMRDNWCVGYSERYTVGVWVGNFSGEPMWNVSGISGAAPVWVEIMTRLHRGGARNNDISAAPPAGLVLGALPDEPGRREWFIRGTESVASPGAVKSSARIVYPAQAAIIAIDPNIPAEDQKLFFEARTGSVELKWELNGQPIGDADGLLLWTPVPGRYILVLTDADGRPIDEVNFEVRGAAIRRKQEITHSQENSD
ncbi:MAG: penicillin-binding protein 1C [Acidobacteriota bacterium]|nr:penicillin-binding protein 1C [Acidobacteriota bacterium]